MHTQHTTKTKFNLLPFMAHSNLRNHFLFRTMPCFYFNQLYNLQKQNQYKKNSRNHQFQKLTQIKNIVWSAANEKLSTPYYIGEIAIQSCRRYPFDTKLL